MSNPAPSEELARIIESARRLGVELNEGDALQWLAAEAGQSRGTCACLRRE